MKNYLLIGVLLAFSCGTAFSQSEDEAQEPVQRSISIQATGQADVGNYDYKVSITLTEYERACDTNVKTEVIGLDEVEKEMLSVLKEFGLSKNDLDLVSITEKVVNNQNYNAMGYASNVQKKHPLRTYNFKWSDSDRLEELSYKLRMQGVEGATIQPVLKGKGVNEARKGAFLLALKKGKADAEAVATELGEEIGEVISVSETPVFTGTYNYNQPVYNYNNGYAVPQMQAFGFYVNDMNPVQQVTLQLIYSLK